MSETADLSFPTHLIKDIEAYGRECYRQGKANAEVKGEADIESLKPWPSEEGVLYSLLPRVVDTVAWCSFCAVAVLSAGSFAAKFAAWNHASYMVGLLICAFMMMAAVVTSFVALGWLWVLAYRVFENPLALRRSDFPMLRRHLAVTAFMMLVILIIGSITLQAILALGITPRL